MYLCAQVIIVLIVRFINCGCGLLVMLCFSLGFGCLGDASLSKFSCSVVYYVCLLCVFVDLVCSFFLSGLVMLFACCLYCSICGYVARDCCCLL